MQSGKKPVNCIPCAKRKVRCDRNRPCNHCKRRKGDECVYPVLNSINAGRGLSGSDERIEQLEAYIERLGGDPKLLEHTPNDAGADAQTQSPSPNHTAGHGQNKDGNPAVRRKIVSPQGHHGAKRRSKRRGFMERDEQIDYTELYVPLLALPIHFNSTYSAPVQCGIAGAA